MKKILLETFFALENSRLLSQVKTMNWESF